MGDPEHARDLYAAAAAAWASAGHLRHAVFVPRAVRAAGRRVVPAQLRRVGGARDARDGAASRPPRPRVAIRAGRPTTSSVAARLDRAMRRSMLPVAELLAARARRRTRQLRRGLARHLGRGAVRPLRRRARRPCGRAHAPLQAAARPPRAEGLDRPRARVDVSRGARLGRGRGAHRARPPLGARARLPDDDHRLADDEPARVAVLAEAGLPTRRSSGCTGRCPDANPAPRRLEDRRRQRERRRRRARAAAAARPGRGRRRRGARLAALSARGRAAREPRAARRAGDRRHRADGAADSGDADRASVGRARRRDRRARASRRPVGAARRSSSPAASRDASAEREVDQFVPPAFARRFRGSVEVHDAESPDLVPLADRGRETCASIRRCSRRISCSRSAPRRRCSTAARACSSARPIRATIRSADAYSLLETAASQGWQLGVAIERALRQRVAVIGTSLVHTLPRLTGMLRGYPVRRRSRSSGSSARRCATSSARCPGSCAGGR